MTINLKVLQVIPKFIIWWSGDWMLIMQYFFENKCGSFIVTSGGDFNKYLLIKKIIKLLRLPVHGKNPLLILINAIILIGIILFYNISIVHARNEPQPGLVL